MILIKSYLTGVFYVCFKLIYAYLNEGDKVRECYSCLKMMMQAHVHVVFSRFYLYMKLLQSSTIFKQKSNHEVSCELKCLREIFYNCQFKKYN